MPAARVSVLALAVATWFVSGATCAAELYYGAERTPVTIWSQGTRVAGTLWRAKGADPSQKRPGILLAHGWGGLREHLDTTYGPKFAAAGFVVLAFDYRGWGESDGRLVPVEPLPDPDDAGRVTVRARVIREVVDPWDQLEDLRAALAVLTSEPDVDPERIGIWGTSYGGGHAVQMAATEPRIRALVAQVGAQGQSPTADARAYAHKRSVEKARGVLDPPIPQGVDQVPGLNGTPDVARMTSYRPLDVAHRIRVPALFIDMEGEELFDRTKHGLAAYEIVREQAPARYELYEGKHYDVYTKHYAAASDLALAWFQEHLLGGAETD